MVEQVEPCRTQHRTRQRTAPTTADDHKLRTVRVIQKGSTRLVLIDDVRHIDVWILPCPRRQCVDEVLALVGVVLALSWPYYAGVGMAAALMVYHWRLIRDRSRDGAFKAFMHNNWVGAAVFAGIVFATR